MENTVPDPSSSDPMSSLGSVFRPQADITVAELASIIQVLLDAQRTVFLPSIVENIHESCQRHFVPKRQVELQNMLYLGASKSN